MFQSFEKFFFRTISLKHKITVNDKKHISLIKQFPVIEIKF